MSLQTWDNGANENGPATLTRPGPGHGGLGSMPRRTLRNSPEQIWSRVVRGDEEDCWPWMGSLSNGYGKVSYHGKGWPVHRLIYEWEVGPVPDGLQLDHLCHNPCCVNPAHLEPVTSRENMRRGESPLAENYRKTHCKHGHPLTGENLRLVPNGRLCVECDRRHSREKRMRAQMKQQPLWDRIFVELGTLERAKAKTRWPGVRVRDLAPLVGALPGTVRVALMAFRDEGLAVDWAPRPHRWALTEDGWRFYDSLVFGRGDGS